MNLHDDGARKYGAEGLLHASKPLSWRGLAADLRYHPAKEIPEFKPQQLEICIPPLVIPECVVLGHLVVTRMLTFVQMCQASTLVTRQDRGRCRLR